MGDLIANAVLVGLGRRAKAVQALADHIDQHPWIRGDVLRGEQRRRALDQADPDSNRRYKGFDGVIGRRPMVSPDGIHWKLLETAELPSSHESNMSFDRAGKTFIATLKRGGPFGCSHRIWTSRNFTEWTDTGVLFHADELNQQLAKKNIDARLSNPKLQQPVKTAPADYNADIYNFGGLTDYTRDPNVIEAARRNLAQAILDARDD
ncbi:MAG: hypothetical protein CL681_25320 [Blastopirellula sp.]|nr:hypothetical protein [Blastopirellula sp.]